MVKYHDSIKWRYALLTFLWSPKTVITSDTNYQASLTQFFVRYWMGLWLVIFMCGQFCLTSLTHWLIPGSSFLPNEDKWVLKSPSFKTFFLAATKMRVAPSRTAAWLSLSAPTYLLKCHSQFGKDHFNRKRFIFTREVVTSNLTWAAFFTCQFKQGILILYYTPVNVVIQKMLTWRRVVMFQRSTRSLGHLFFRPRLPDLWHVLWFS